MFGFIKKKIKAFTDAFSEEAEEETVEDVEGVQVDEQVESAADAESVAEPVDVETDDDVRSDEAEAQPLAEPEEAVTSDESKSREVETQAASIAPESEVPEATPAEVEAEPATKAEASDEAHAPHAPAPDVERDVAPAPFAPAEAEKPAPESTPVAPEPKAEKRGLRQRFMGALTKRTLSEQQFDTLFTDLEIGLLEANTAYDAVQAVKENLRERLTGERVSRFSASDDVSVALKESIAELFEPPEDLIALADSEQPLVIMLIGINGSGKTTTAAKLARAYQRAGKTPVLAAADTFRAAAIQQLEAHANALDVRIIKHDYGADPAAVAFDAVSHAKSGKADVVLIDTAGRLHSNENLLNELKKVKRVVQPHRIIFVGESIAGNDLLEQAETFNEKIGIDGIILTKTDVDESGGGALSVSHVTRKPIDYFGAGQSYDDLEAFSVDRMAQLLGLE